MFYLIDAAKGVSVTRTYDSLTVILILHLRKNALEPGPDEMIRVETLTTEPFQSTMNEILEFVVRHGAAVLFAAVFVEQLGIPLPAAPWLLAGGALAAGGEINWLTALSAATFGSMLADLIWFYLG